MLATRLATENDIAVICSFDHIAQEDLRRRDFIARFVGTACCSVAVIDSEVVAYGVLNDSFFGYGFISLLYIDQPYRRRGIGMALMQHLESLCSTPKLFTSTNLSNQPMQSLLARRNYMLSGVIHNIDEADPELIYFRLLSAPTK